MKYMELTLKSKLIGIANFEWLLRILKLHMAYKTGPLA